MARRIRKIALIVVLSLLGLVLLALLTATVVMRGSLANLDGKVKLTGLSAPATATRDNLGVPDITAENRIDVARILGYLHAQERFFQMDLQRRSAAGELAALLGPALVGTDRSVRIHRFRHRAAKVVAGLVGEEKAILDAYTAGVNAGLDELNARPFEYLLLRKKPQPWHQEDTVLTLYAMFMDLSLSTANTERHYANVRDNLPAGLAEMLLPRSNRWGAPIQNDPVPGVVIPDTSAFDVRQWKFGDKSYEEFRDQVRQEREQTPHQDTAGSNNWAVSGWLTGHGGAILANDMHLGHSLPNIWYRARLNWPDHSVVGVTLPGTPSMVAGSNGKLAWGFTNSYGDWVDLVVLEFDPENPNRYLTPDGWQDLVRVPEIIQVDGAPADTLWVDETIWGPVYSQDTNGQSLALRWTAHDTEAVNLELRYLETAETLEEAVALAGTAGMPQQNLVLADHQGRIAWTIVGPIPNRVGWDGRLPVSWADGTCRWDGYRPADQQPKIIEPHEGRLWSANSRVTAGEFLDIIGDGGYGLGARAGQIRDGLRAMDKPTEKDLLALQLDDRAVFRGHWRDLALATLEKHPPAENSDRARFQTMVRDHWSGRADTGSVSYRLVRSFNFNCVDAVYYLLAGPCRGADPDFRLWELPYTQAVTWEVIAAQPDNLLPPWSESWDDFVLQAIDKAMENFRSFDIPLEQYTWGGQHKVQVSHPFTQIVPALSRWLDAPKISMPGDSYMPRVQQRSSGASQRMVVSPGKEELGIFHMPGGQSGHPLSPYYLKGHEDWVEGRATPLLPGAEEHRLEFLPRGD